MKTYTIEENDLNELITYISNNTVTSVGMPILTRLTKYIKLKEQTENVNT
jgi:hypothetical protein